MTKKPDRSANTLDDLNDHLARFFRHADTLLAEWKSYGERVRGEIDGEVAKLQGTVSAAVEDAGRKATQSLDGQVESSLGDGLARLRGEVDRLTRLASEANAKLAGAAAGGGAAGGGTVLGAGGSGPRSMLTLVALVSANVMLAVLIALSARSCGDDGETAGTATEEPRPGIEASGAAGEGEGEGEGASEGEGEGASEGGAADAGVAEIDGGPSAMAPVCEALAKGYDVEAAKKLIEAAAVQHCGDAAGGIAETVNGRLIVPKAQGTGKKGKGKRGGRGGT